MVRPSTLCKQRWGQEHKWGHSVILALRHLKGWPKVHVVIFALRYLNKLIYFDQLII